MKVRLAQSQLAKSEVFRGIVEASCIHVAQSVRSESEETENHLQRDALALTFLLPEGGNRAEFLGRFVWAAAMDEGVRAECTLPSGSIEPDGVQDSTIDGVVTRLWDQMAGGTESGRAS